MKTDVVRLSKWSVYHPKYQGVTQTSYPVSVCQMVFLMVGGE